MSVHFDDLLPRQCRAECPSTGDSFASQEEEIDSKRRRFPSRRRSRTNFSESQCALLERTFSHTHYPDHQVKREIAFRLGIASDRVTVWFQNRRSKWRRSNCAAVGPLLCPSQKRHCEEIHLHQQQNSLCQADDEAQNGFGLSSTHSLIRPDSAELATPEMPNGWTEGSR